MSGPFALSGVEIAHAVRGRVRLKLARSTSGATRAEQIRAALQELPGIEIVEHRPGSGSVVVCYDPDHHDDVWGVLNRLAPARSPVPTSASQQSAPSPTKRRKKPPAASASGGASQAPNAHRPPKTKIDEATEQIEEEAEFLAEHSHMAKAVVEFAKGVDNRLKAATNNNVDLKILAPIGLAAVTFLEIGAAAATPMWVTLVLFSMNHFVELHAHDSDDDEEDDDEGEDGTDLKAAAE